MFISASEAVNSDTSTDANISNSEEAMPAVISSNSMLLSSKRSASSASEADCYNMSLGAGPLWWSDAPGETRGSPPLRLTFRTGRQPWDTVLQGRTLYVALPPRVLAEGSRESFVALLEAAEEDLKCEHVIVVFANDHPERAKLIRTFMFFGFTVLSPTSPLMPPSLASGNVCMVYNIEE
ncbi:LOW QUALITY PROTEIN: ornithine decarboxylase antizyme 1 [Anoplophora glabripennis]|uniref:LOW QUALITY PROTEIN: ornithine decarboxylase antizyme 1 n=1 Tax=Anoplophora glabripennis TaxID=217634 RepID=UPI00087531F0|nr:LOW QUALITY PROTEIN: ornithine decarboxylase antizyme 1 [Anoplophora glabripennis]